MKSNDSQLRSRGYIENHELDNYRGYEKDESMLNELMTLFDKYRQDDVMVWKLLRALQSFNDERTIEILNQYINADVIQHRWEAKRSLEQIKRRQL